MPQRLVCVLLTSVAVCCALTAKSEFVTSPEIAKNEPNSDKLLTTIVRGRNSSKVSHLTKSNDSEVHDRGSDKQARTTTTHRSESETRDKYGWQAQGQPPGSSGITGRPGSGNYVGTALHEGSQAGDRFGSRPSYGSESSRRPSGYESSASGGYGYGNGGYGGYGSGRPTGYGGSGASGGYGISGMLDNGDEFGPGEPNYPEGNGPPHPNIQTQKAVALKALAGVALIGAAAALAANPVLLPIGIVAGRKKRSNLSVKDEDAHMNYILRNLKSNFTKVDGNGNGKNLLISPTCIARMACEIQKNYWSDLSKNVERKTKSEYRFADLISSNLLNKEMTSVRIKKMMKVATTVALNGGNCNAFACTFVKIADPKKQFTIKL